MSEKKYKYRDKHFAPWDLEKGFPEDFWNHRVNPITGFYVERESQKKGLDKKYSDSEKTLPISYKTLSKYSNN